MKYILIVIALIVQLEAIDYKIEVQTANSSIVKVENGLGLSISDYETKYKSGINLGWSIGLSSTGTNLPTQSYNETYFEKDGIMIEALFTPLIRFRETYEYYVILGVAWDNITNHDYGSGIEYGFGYQQLISNENFIGFRVSERLMKYNSLQDITNEYDGKNYRATLVSIYYGFRY